VTKYDGNTRTEPGGRHDNTTWIDGDSVRKSCLIIDTHQYITSTWTQDDAQKVEIDAQKVENDEPIAEKGTQHTYAQRQEVEKVIMS
jgi:hypothetical protein